MKAPSLVKSRQRVIDHGEVFTPAWLVEAMLDSVKDESERIDSRFLEPACGSGNFLVPVLKRKLAVVAARYGTSDVETRNHALLALMCIYGIELLADNAAECRLHLLRVFAEFLRVDASSELYRAALRVLEVNIITGDALTLTSADGEAIVFPEWALLANGMFQRRDFRYDALMQTSRSGSAARQFADLGHRAALTPVTNYPALTIGGIAGG